MFKMLASYVLFVCLIVYFFFSIKGLIFANDLLMINMLSHKPSNMFFYLNNIIFLSVYPLPILCSVSLYTTTSLCTTGAQQ